MSDVQAPIIEPSPPGISEKDRRWAILQWLSVKLVDAPYDKILEIARDFEDYIVGNVAGRDISDDAISSITKLDPKAGQILAAAAKKESDAAGEPERAAPIGKSPASRQMADRMGSS